MLLTLIKFDVDVLMTMTDQTLSVKEEQFFSSPQIAETKNVNSQHFLSVKAEKKEIREAGMVEFEESKEKQIENKPESEEAKHYKEQEDLSIPSPHGISIPDNHDTTAVIAAIATLMAAISSLTSETERMYYFLARSFQMAQWSPEANIAASVLVLRWVQEGKQLNLENWKSTLLLALLVAQKVTDDVPLANREFCTIWQSVSEEPELFTPNMINHLESQFLLDLDWHVFVDTGTMIEVYHELVNLAESETDGSSEAKQ
jgi:hypothetical protein